MTYLAFLRGNARWLGAGALMTLGSTFGQTSFISIYAGEIRETFGLSHGAWGLSYTAGTFVSALLLFSFGGIVDRVRARVIGSLVLAGLALTCVLMSLNPVAWTLPVLVLGLRFFGQGMLTHVPITAAGRWFSATRGRAVSAITLGVSIGEAMLPFIFVSLMALYGWRASWAIAGGVLLLAIPLLMTLLRQERTPQTLAKEAGGLGLHHRHWSRRDVLGHWLFWVTLPVFMAQPVFVTALFFQQVHLTVLKGWDLADFVGTFPLFTLANVGALFLGGWISDRWGAHRLAPVAYLPLAIALAIMAVAETVPVAAVAMVALGLSMGFGGALSGAYWAEVYGTRHLGSIRAVATAVMVFASAVGPGVTGVLIDAGVDFRTQLLAMAAFTFAMCGVFFGAMARIRADLPGGTQVQR
ncbi:MAG: MFS transporter [Pseudomonadota bacterium]